MKSRERLQTAEQFCREALQSIEALPEAEKSWTTTRALDARGFRQSSDVILPPPPPQKGKRDERPERNPYMWLAKTVLVLVIGGALFLGLGVAPGVPIVASQIFFGTATGCLSGAAIAVGCIYYLLLKERRKNGR